MALAVVRSPEEWRRRFPAARTEVSVGNFDGLHLGHQRILAEVVARARAGERLAAAVTFDPHPLRILRPAEAPALLMTLEQRLAALERIGLDAALVLRFDRTFSELSPENFARHVLVDTLGASEILVGANFKFGHRQAGDVACLSRLGAKFGYRVETIAPVVVRGEIVSSSAVRQAVRAGDVRRAGRLLGRPFALEGRIQPGSGQGHKQVVPTLNLATAQELLPATGVYVTETVSQGRKYGSVTNVGMRPTFSGDQLTVESHLFDFHAERDAGNLEIRFCKRLREERKFASPSELKEQILCDIASGKKFFRRTKRFFAAPRT